MTVRVSARDVARLLAAEIHRLAPEIAPGGRREGAEWSARCPWRADRSAGSFKIRLYGPRAGVWADFATGDSGDALDLVARAKFAGDLRAALAWAAARFGLGAPVTPGTAPAAAPATPSPRPPDGPDPDTRARQEVARRIWLAAQAGLAGTPAAFYLAARRIDLAVLGRQPRSLRFHPGLFEPESRRRWPALVAAITGPGGDHVATHRTWLARDSAGI